MQSAPSLRPAGYLDTDNLISHEGGYFHPLTLFDQLGVRGGAYVGVGPDQNFGGTRAALSARFVFLQHKHATVEDWGGRSGGGTIA